MRWDARLLVWLLVVVFATGTVLMVFFDSDAQDHRDRLGTFGTILRHLHAASSLAVVAGTLAHVAVRFRGGTRKGIQTGAYTLGAVAVAAVTGALAAQTEDADRIAQGLGLDAAPVIPAAVVHIAYATLLVLLTLYFHVARWGWAHVLDQRSQLLLAILVSGALAWLLPVALPGGDGGGTTALLAPPRAWTWSLAIAVGLWLAGRAPRKNAVTPS